MSLKKGSSKPDWLPDWKDVTKYPHSKKGRVWAWEFLRRNPQYQQLWDKYAALPPGPLYTGNSAHAFMDICQRFERQFGVSHSAPPSMPFTHPDFKWRPRFAAQSPRHWIMQPDDDIDMEGAHLDHQAEVLMKFDLRLQLSPQLTGAKAILNKEAKRLKKAGLLGGQPRAKFEKYQTYLRLLDAKSSGASSKEIAKEILGIKDKTTLEDTQYVKEKVDEVFEPAKRLRDGGYRFLAAKQGK